MSISSPEQVPHNLIDQINNGNGYYAFTGFAKRDIGMILWPGSNGENRGKVRHHGP
ncbi:MAG TPA: hypothetical protein VKA34_00915 [Balneolales bacterium]|nr:hypothetical protein [Balneolales bacterium]